MYFRLSGFAYVDHMAYSVMHSAVEFKSTCNWEKKLVSAAQSPILETALPSGDGCAVPRQYSRAVSWSAQSHDDVTPLSAIKKLPTRPCRLESAHFG